MKNVLKGSISCLVILCVLVITTSSGLQPRGIKASGNYVTKTIKTSNFKGIDVWGSVDVVYTQSENGRTSVKVCGSDNLVDLVEIEVQGNALNVKLKNDVNIFSLGEKGLKVLVSSPEINHISLQGSGDIYLQSIIRSTDLDIKLQGSGDIKTEEINCNTLLVTLQGSGDLEFRKEIQAEAVEFLLRGSGDISLQTILANSAKFTLHGSGDMKVEGKTVVGSLATQLNGSGDVQIHTIQGKTVVAELKGSGDMMLNGTAHEAILTILQSSGTINASGLEAQQVDAKVSGSGSLSCYPILSLKAKTSGSGDIRYKGTPGKLDVISKGAVKRM